LKSHLYISEDPATGLKRLDAVCGISVEDPTPVDSWAGDVEHVLEQIKKARGLCQKCRKAYEEGMEAMLKAMEHRPLGPEYVYSVVAGAELRAKSSLSCE
jgi:hypothetical protein